jgi:recombinational DNA repair protein (RecF pathway)
MELVEKLATEEKSDVLWSHIISVMDRIAFCSFEATDVDRLLAEENAFFLALHGWTPRTDVCVVCKKTAAHISGFHLKEGGVVCVTCASGGAYIYTLQKCAGEELGAFFRKEYDVFDGKRELFSEIRHILEHFLEFMSSERIYSKYFLLYTQENHIA